MESMEAGTIIIILFLTGFVCGITCAGIASARGLNPGGWFALGFFFNIGAILFAAIAPPNQETLKKERLERGTHKKCPECAEVVKAEAVKCRYCHSGLPKQDTETSKKAKNNPVTKHVMKPCPLCEQLIKAGSTFCPHCMKDLPTEK